MNLSQVVEYLHPGASAFSDYMIVDRGDGPQIAIWNLPGEPPTQEEIEAVMALPEHQEATPQDIDEQAEVKQAIEQAGVSSAKTRRRIRLVEIDLKDALADYINAELTDKLNAVIDAVNEKLETAIEKSTPMRKMTRKELEGLVLAKRG